MSGFGLTILLSIQAALDVALFPLGLGFVGRSDGLITAHHMSRSLPNLKTLPSVGLTSIALDYKESRKSDDYGNGLQISRQGEGLTWKPVRPLGVGRVPGFCSLSRSIAERRACNAIAALLIPKRHHRIYFRCAARRHQAGKQSNYNEQQGNSTKRRRIVCGYSEEQTRHQSR